MTDTDGKAVIRAKARELFDAKFREAGWTEADFRSYAGSGIRAAVVHIAMAANCELAAVEEVIGHFGFMGMPSYDPATGQSAPSLTVTLCMEVIQEVRHAQFPRNTGWIWDEKDQQWACLRGGMAIVARFPRDQMPPLPADRFGIQAGGLR